MEEDRHEADACEICGSDNEIGKFLLGSRIVIRCRDCEAGGISLEAEQIYWGRRLSQLENESNNEQDKGI